MNVNTRLQQEQQLLKAFAQEHPSFIAAAILAGGLVAGLLGAGGIRAYADANTLISREDWRYFLAPIIEELLKFAVATVVLVGFLPAPWSPRLAIFTGALTGLGFSIMETAVIAGIDTDVWTLRLLTTTLAHVLFSACACAALGMANRQRWLAPAVLFSTLATAMYFHWSFNHYDRVKVAFLLVSTAALAVGVFVGSRRLLNARDS